MQLNNEKTLIIKKTDSAITKNLKMFFDEKDLPLESWDIMSKNGTMNYIDNEVVIEHILVSPESEKKQISNMITKIDFMNGNVNHFLKHLAGAIARDF